ncbi:hypothetical protein MRB53_020282 [Persea americana]|uniref:Uncharacterized protein n=1 Tax=Persea americana TaxID=3435 RepID=A0ACC2L117_PERAE|nr:hypothetical protein MRB53_020282 [Persea americana]
MDSSSTNGRSKATLSTETLSALAEGIPLLLSQWTALQMAIQNEWGGRDSRQKSAQLASDLLNWFAHSKVPHYVDDLENMLDETMVLSFNTEVEDGSIEEQVAEQLMIMHEECLQGHFESIENLRKCNEATEAVSLSRQVINDDKDESTEDEASDMAVDETKPRTGDGNV